MKVNTSQNMRKYDLDKKCIAIFSQKLITRYENGYHADYVLKRIILYEDFLDGVLKGYYYDGGMVLYLNEDTKSFYINGYDNYNTCDPEGKEIEEYHIAGCRNFFDSLVYGDVITFNLKADIDAFQNYVDDGIFCEFDQESLKISNPEKYPDQSVIEKILTL